MASTNLGDLHVTVNFDIEPTEKAKDFVRMVVLTTLKETLMESTWLQELIAERVKEVQRDGS